MRVHIDALGRLGRSREGKVRDDFVDLFPLLFPAEIFIAKQIDISSIQVRSRCRGILNFALLIRAIIGESHSVLKLKGCIESSLFIRLITGHQISGGVLNYGRLISPTTNGVLKLKHFLDGPFPDVSGKGVETNLGLLNTREADLTIRAKSNYSLNKKKFSKLFYPLSLLKTLS